MFIIGSTTVSSGFDAKFVVSWPPFTPPAPTNARHYFKVIQCVAVVVVVVGLVPHSARGPSSCGSRQLRYNSKNVFVGMLEVQVVARAVHCLCPSPQIQVCNSHSVTDGIRATIRSTLPVL